MAYTDNFMGSTAKTTPRIKAPQAFQVNPNIMYVNEEFCVSVNRIPSDIAPCVLSKFTESNYPPRHCGTLSLIRPTFYRANSVAGEMSDPREGTVFYDTSNTDATITVEAKAGVRDNPITLPLARFETEINMPWFLSMSMASYQCCPKHGKVFESLEAYQHFKRGGKDAVSFISEFQHKVDHFAYRLGAEFGVYCKDNLARIYRRVYNHKTLQETDNAVMVIHGPVTYVASKSAYLNRYDHEDGTRSVMSLFVKDSDFAIEQEYRFVMLPWGDPKVEYTQMILPISPTLGSFFTPPWRNNVSFGKGPKG